MKRLAYAKRRDANEPEIVNALKSIGCAVHRMDDPVDLLVGYRGKAHLIEVKTPRGSLTDSQIEFIADWPGDVHVVTTAEQAIEVVTQ